MNLDGIQPYLGVGLGLSILDVEKFAVLNTDESSVGETSGESNSSVGLLISAGLNYTLTKHTKVYGEFKYKDTSFEFDKLDGANKYEFDASETSFVFGLSYHF
jgi:opacity protein-like surface antigen